MQRISLMLFFLICCLIVSCNGILQCERHFIPVDYTGSIVIYFDQKGGQKLINKNGCKVFDISPNGECFSAFPFKVGVGIPKETMRFFERRSGDSLNEIFEFRESEYLKDSAGNRHKKYIFILSSGSEDATYFFKYDVDYGINYKRHIYY